MAELTNETLKAMEEDFRAGRGCSDVDGLALIAEVRGRGTALARMERDEARAEVVRLRGLLEGQPEKLACAADWLDLLDAALDALAGGARGELRAQWSEALGDSDHDEVQRDMRTFASEIARVLSAEEPQP